MSVRPFLPPLLGLLLAAGTILPATGCALSNSSGRPSGLFGSWGEREASDEGNEDWEEQVGKDARGNRPRERDPDPWWQRYVMSEKARAIERNLGID
jgi:hypothetical protein